MQQAFAVFRFRESDIQILKATVLKEFKFDL